MQELDPEPKPSKENEMIDTHLLFAAGVVAATVAAVSSLHQQSQQTPHSHIEYVTNSTEVIFKSVIIFQIYSDDVGYQRVLAGCDSASYVLLDISTEIIEATPYTEMEQAIYTACAEAQQWI